jgi:hypothetical protein
MARENITHIGDHRNGTTLMLAGSYDLQTEKQALFQPRGIHNAEHLLYFWIPIEASKCPTATRSSSEIGRSE